MEYSIAGANEWLFIFPQLDAHPPLHWMGSLITRVFSVSVCDGAKWCERRLDLWVSVFNYYIQPALGRCYHPYLHAPNGSNPTLVSATEAPGDQLWHGSDMLLPHGSLPAAADSLTGKQSCKTGVPNANAHKPRAHAA
ncbi:unnamed protein product [Gadus morhua 'NCC']